MSKSVVRSVKNVTKGYSSVQVKVRNATSNDAWPPSGTEMAEIAALTFNTSEFYEIVDMLDKRLNDKGKNWRHVLKSLKVLDYCLHQGSELAVTWAIKNIYIIKTLREFQYIDEDGRDVGMSVRQSAKELTALISDEERLKAERRDRQLWKARVTGLDEFGPMKGYAGGQSPSKPRRRERPDNDDDDAEYRLALEASKNEAEEDKRRRESKSIENPDDDDLARAIKLSQEEEELRRRELEQQNEASLFDDTPTPTQQQTQPTGWNQGYQQQGAVDWFGNPVDQQQPQNTGYLNNIYNQPTGFQNGLGYNQFQQPQQMGFDQMQFQQHQQPQFIQPQQTAFNMNNPYSQQLNGFGQAQQQQQPQEDAAKPGTKNPWANLENQDSLAPQPTGSNNPFATSVNTRQPQNISAQRAPTLNTLQEQKTTAQFNQFSMPTKTSPMQQQPQKETDPYSSRLNALLASGDGQDTFGNIGDLRIPAQHTAPGVFVNSAGSGAARLQPAQTGFGSANPFMQSQFTGMPSAGQTQPQPQSGGFGSGGFGPANPFGQQQSQQQPQQSSQGGSLIDL